MTSEPVDRMVIDRFSNLSLACFGSNSMERVVAESYLADPQGSGVVD
nr:hypothetical protein [Mycobacterium ulcerans]